MQTQQKKFNLNQPLATETAIEKEMLDLSLVTDPDSFSLEDALQELEETRQEAEEAYESDDQIDPVPNSAYGDARVLLKILHRNVPMPDIGWAEDGSIGFEWRPENGIATMSIYGDNLVIYGAFFSDKREFDGICALSDTILLDGFVTTLRNLFYGKHP